MTTPFFGIKTFEYGDPLDKVRSIENVYTKTETDQLLNDASDNAGSVDMNEYYHKDDVDDFLDELETTNMYYTSADIEREINEEPSFQTLGEITGNMYSTAFWLPGRMWVEFVDGSNNKSHPEDNFNYLEGQLTSSGEGGNRAVVNLGNNGLWIGFRNVDHVNIKQRLLNGEKVSVRYGDVGRIGGRGFSSNNMSLLRFTSGQLSSLKAGQTRLQLGGNTTADQIYRIEHFTLGNKLAGKSIMLDEVLNGDVVFNCINHPSVNNSNSPDFGKDFAGFKIRIGRRDASGNLFLPILDTTFRFSFRTLNGIRRVIRPNDFGAKLMNIYNRFELDNILDTKVENDNGDVKLLNLPTTDPQVENQLWNDNGVLKISSG